MLRQIPSSHTPMSQENPTPPLLTRPRFQSRSRRQGIAIVYTAIGMLALMGAGAITLDYGYLQIKRQQVQASADAAALAGAWHLANYTGSVVADAKAREYASKAENGGYTQGVKGAQVKVTYPAKDETGALRNNWFRIDIARPEPTFFAMFYGRSSVMVGATATAIYETLAEFDINGAGDYGVAPGPSNLSLFGPKGFYNNGDCYSVEKLPNGQPNPLNSNWGGYDFAVRVPSNLTNTTLEIFDPDCYNANNSTEASYPNSIDEYRNASGGASNNVSDRTTTKYTLYYDNGTPANPKDDIEIASKSWGSDSTTDMKWVSAFNFNRSSTAYKNGNFRLNVISTAGASENGFDLRVGKTRGSRENFDPNNGTVIKAMGHLPINFNQGGMTKIALGKIPVQAAGGTLSVRKFDTDVGALSITYSCDTLTAAENAALPKGILTGNGTFTTDVLNVPKTYTTEGTWYAEYQAGVQDTSVWDMSYSNSGPGKPGGIKLIR
jgi:hypothetical protein